MSDTHGQIEKLLGEDKLGMVAAGRLVGDTSAGPPIHPSTVTRWCLKGVRRPGGLIKLEHFRVGAKIFTTRQAVVRFIEAQTAGTVVVAVPAVRTPASRQRAIERATAELERLGV